MSKGLKIITLGDIFKNIETEEKAFKFLKYIKDLQHQLEQEKQKLKMIDEYTWKIYNEDNQNWVDHIRDIINDR